MTTSTERLWNDLSGELRAFIARRVPNDPAVVDDLLQETFLRIHDGLQGLQTENRLAAWVYRIARNVITDHHRRTRRAPGALDDAAGDPAAGSETPENLNRTVNGWLVDMVGMLPERYREALRLVEIEGLTQRDAAEALRISVSGAKSRVQRGRRLLARRLLDCCHIELDRRGNVVDTQRRRPCTCRSRDVG